MKKIAVFVDVQNIYYTTRQAYAGQFNYREFWQRISSQGEIVCAFAYAIHRGDEKQLNFQEILKQIGFTVIGVKSCIAIFIDHSLHGSPYYSELQSSRQLI